VMHERCEPNLASSPGRCIHTLEVGLRGSPALYLALRRLSRGLSRPIPFLHHLVTFSDFIDSMDRSDFRQLGRWLRLSLATCSREVVSI